MWSLEGEERSHTLNQNLTIYNAKSRVGTRLAAPRPVLGGDGAPRWMPPLAEVILTRFAS